MDAPHRNHIFVLGLLLVCSKTVAAVPDGGGAPVRSRIGDQGSPATQLVPVRVFRIDDGKGVSLGDLGLKRRPVLFILWATWCEPCLKEMPRLERLNEQFGQAVRFIGIAQDLNGAANRRAVKQLADTAKLTYPQFVEADGETIESRMLGQGVSALPAFVLYSSDGTKVFSLIGSLDRQAHHDSLTTELRKLAAAAAREQGRPGTGMSQ